MIALSPAERRAIDILIDLPAAPPYVVDERGIVDEARSDHDRRVALAEIAESKFRARSHSDAVVDAYDAKVRGATLRPYTMAELVIVSDALHAAGLGHMVTSTITTRLRAVEIQAWMASARAQHAAE